MHIGIFAERFIGRYGADRVLVIIAEQLRQAGHRVTLVGVRFSPAVLDGFAGQTLRIPDYTGRAPDERTRVWLEANYYFFQRHLPPFDSCIVGGYPFLSSIPYLRRLAKQVLFIDFGVVPTFGYGKPLTQLIENLKQNRQKYLRHATEIVAISSFIAEDQSRKDCEDKVPVIPILLGADHLVGQLGYTELSAKPREQSFTRGALNTLLGMGRKLILVLGRWEPGCYKNSQAAFDVLRSLIDYEPDVALMAMAEPAYFWPPPDLVNHAFCIGLPSDADLLDVTRNLDAGISVSLWEGFNLPVAELQYEEKHVFAFKLAAHPEVVVSQDQLCGDAEDMAAKLLQALEKESRPAWAESGALSAWKEQFTWQRFMSDFSRVVERAA
jgi:glycosyltransferase involved in cell wall biosynthesis